MDSINKTIIVAEKEMAGTRIDVFISDSLEELTRSSVKKMIEDGTILVNGKKTKANYKLREKDSIEIEFVQPEELDIVAENIPLEILFEDKDIIVINKPQGMVVHPAPGHYCGTLVNALLFHCAGQLSGMNGKMRPGIVHRIDKDTSGVLMAAKTNIAHQSLALQLSDHSITRKYNAIVYNSFQEEEGTVDKPIGRHPQDRKKMAVTAKNSRNAVTHYKVLKKLGKYTLIEAQLETGRTHQIRVHMSYINHPLLGDEVYGPKKQPFSLAGQVLHARVLGFYHPVTKKYMEFEAQLPQYFQKLIQRLETTV